MLWQWSPSVISEAAAAAVLLVLAIYVPWRELNRRASLFGTSLLLSCALWILSHAVEIGLPVASAKGYLMSAQLIWGTLAVTFWWLYIVHHIGSEKWLTRRSFFRLGILPGIVIVGIWTNPFHHLIWSSPGLDSVNPYLPLQPTYGIVYWIGMAYIFVLTLSGSFLLIKNVLRRHHGRTRESVGLMIAAALPMLAALVETLGLSSSLKLSIGITPWASFIGGLLLLWNLPRFHLRKVIPLARDTIFERIEDGIIVLDPWDRIIDLNPAAERLLDYEISAVRGLAVKQILPQWPDAFGIAGQTLESDKEIILDREGDKRTYNLSVSLVPDPDGHPTSRLVLLTDVSYRKKIEDALREGEKSILTSLREKEVLLREVHHRVKNNMQVISSLFNLQAGRTLNEEGRAILKEAQARIRTISLVHEKLYQSADLSRIDLAGYINSLAVHLVHFYRSQPGLLRLETDFEETTLNITSAIPCGLILNELISNSLKHAFAENQAGVIRIGLKSGLGGLIEIQVADNGVGLPADLDFRKAESLGLQIVNLLAGQLEAAIELDRSKGTAFTLTFRETESAYPA